MTRSRSLASISSLVPLARLRPRLNVHVGRRAARRCATLLGVDRADDDDAAARARARERAGPRAEYEGNYTDLVFSNVAVAAARAHAASNASATSLLFLLARVSRAAHGRRARARASSRRAERRDVAPAPAGGGARGAEGDDDGGGSSSAVPRGRRRRRRWARRAAGARPRARGRSAATTTRSRPRAPRRRSASTTATTTTRRPPRPRLARVVVVGDDGDDGDDGLARAVGASPTTAAAASLTTERRAFAAARGDRPGARPRRRRARRRGHARRDGERARRARAAHGVLVVHSDNGGFPCASELAGSNAPLRAARKFNWFDGGVKVPAFVYGPGVVPESREGASYAGLMHHVDWTATFLAPRARATCRPRRAGRRSDSLNHWPGIANGTALHAGRTIAFSLGDYFAIRRGPLKLLRSVANARSRQAGTAVAEHSRRARARRRERGQRRDRRRRARDALRPRRRPERAREPRPRADYADELAKLNRHALAPTRCAQVLAIRSTSGERARPPASTAAAARLRPAGGGAVGGRAAHRLSARGVRGPVHGPLGRASSPLYRLHRTGAVGDSPWSREGGRGACQLSLSLSLSRAPPESARGFQHPSARELRRGLEQRFAERRCRDACDASPFAGRATASSLSMAAPLAMAADTAAVTAVGCAASEASIEAGKLRTACGP